jgi:2-amino-4-hydroxy-6-hydroxymethyldihydropteridine diphosphokinase
VSAAGGALGAGEGYAIEQVDVALGSNVEDRATHLAAARAAIGHLPRTRIVATSTVEETAPVGPRGRTVSKPDAALATALAPRELLDRLLAVEAAAGRARDRPDAGARAPSTATSSVSARARSTSRG